MTDERRRPSRTPDDRVAPPLEARPQETAARPARRRRGIAGGRIAAAGIGIAAMLGLAANMQVASGRASADFAADPAPAPGLDATRTAKGLRQGPATSPGRIAAANVRKPIVLTPHAVVNTVGAPSSGGSGGSYAGSYSAPAASAPVATTSGSR